MCYECEGLGRKPITTVDEQKIYREGGWEQVEKKEVAMCRRARLMGVASGSSNGSGDTGGDNGTDVVGL